MNEYEVWTTIARMPWSDRMLQGAWSAPHYVPPHTAYSREELARWGLANQQAVDTIFMMVGRSYWH